MGQYATRDLGLAAAMVCYGKEVVALKPYNERAFMFTLNVEFTEGKSLENDFYNSQMMVPAFKLMQEIRTLKQRIEEEVSKNR